MSEATGFIEAIQQLSPAIAILLFQAFAIYVLGKVMSSQFEQQKTLQASWVTLLQQQGALAKQQERQSDRLLKGIEAELNEERSERKQREDELEARIAGQGALIADLQKQLQDKNRELDALTKRLESRDKEFADLKGAFEKEKKEREKVEEERDRLSSRVEALEKQVTKEQKADDK